MLEAHKHRRLVLKSQGFQTGSSWWSSAGKGKGGGAQEKGKKGDNKGQGKGRGKGAGKETWTSKGEANPWKESKEVAGKK